MLQSIVPRLSDGPRHARGVAGAVEPQVVLEGHDRRERRDVGRRPQDLGAVDDVALHDRELVVGQLVRLVEDLERRPHLADVVHQRGEAELAQQGPSN